VDQYSRQFSIWLTPVEVQIDEAVGRCQSLDRLTRCSDLHMIDLGGGAEHGKEERESLTRFFADRRRSN
jgi:hypothetical protein